MSPTASRRTPRGLAGRSPRSEEIKRAVGPTKWLVGLYRRRFSTILSRGTSPSRCAAAPNAAPGRTARGPPRTDEPWSRRRSRMCINRREERHLVVPERVRYLTVTPTDLEDRPCAIHFVTSESASVGSQPSWSGIPTTCGPATATCRRPAATSATTESHEVPERMRAAARPDGRQCGDRGCRARYSRPGNGADVASNLNLHA